MDLRIVLGGICLQERVVGDSERQSVKTLKFDLIEIVLGVDNRINRAFILLLDRGDVLLELFGLLLLECLKHLRSLEQLYELSSERTLFNWTSTFIFIWLRWIKDEMDNTAIGTLNKPRLLAACLLGNHCSFDTSFGLSE